MTMARKTKTMAPKTKARGKPNRRVLLPKSTLFFGRDVSA